MSTRTAYRKVLALEAHVGHVLDDCCERAWRRLTYTEQEHLQQLFAAHRSELLLLDARDIPRMPRPDWAPPEQWATLQRYEMFYFEEYRRRVGQYEADL